MQIYQCPNCGRIYRESENVYYCGNCNYRLLKQEDIKEVRHPELSKRDYHVIGYVGESTNTIVKCPYCNSTDTKKITNLSKAVHTAVFGIWSMGRNSKEWHCNHCDSDF